LIELLEKSSLLSLNSNNYQKKPQILSEVFFIYNTMRIFTNYKNFCEAKLSDLLRVKGDSDLSNELNKIKDKEFDLTQKLPKKIILDNDSLLRISWYDTFKHDLVKKIKERTSFSSIDHFIEYLKEKLIDIFPYMLGKELFRSGRYSIFLEEYNISIIIEFDLNKNMNDNYFIGIITVLPGRKGDNIIRFIDIN